MMKEFPAFLFPLLADDCGDVVPFIAIRCYLFRNGCLPYSFKRLLLAVKKTFLRIVFLAGGWSTLNAVRRSWVPHPTVLRVRGLAFPFLACCFISPSFSPRRSPFG